MMFRLLGFLCLVFSCLCDRRLLVDQLRWDFLELEDKMWNVSSNGLLDQSPEDAEFYLVKLFNDFDKKLEQIPQNLLYGVEPLRTIPDFLFFYSELKIIETMYQKFKQYQHFQLEGNKDKVTMDDIIYDITNNKTGAQQSVGRIFEIAILQRDSMKQELDRMLKENYWCKNTQQSPQQMFYNLYNLIALNDLKSYIMQQFAYLGNRIWEKGNNVELSISTRKSYERRVIRLLSGLTMALEKPQDIWRCDPKIFIKGKNYDEFTRLLQGNIQNEADMSRSQTCKQTCDEYSYTQSYRCYDYQSDFCQKMERCTGKIIGCFFVESHASICVSKSPPRRYDFIRFNSGKVYGSNSYCTDRRTVNSWTRWFVRCHYCMCLCDQEGSLSDRYINLRPVMADVKNNRVVTGLRMVKHNRILHLQIQEGKLLPYGYIDERTVHWVNVENYKITDFGIEEQIDFFKMSYTDRSMAMDEIQVNEENHVVTGVRFDLINKKIHFKIHVSPFNWSTGEVDRKQGFYIDESTPNVRSKIVLKKADIPIKTSKPSEMFYSGTNTYVEFTHTDFDKDAAQTTIPFIDTQEVINKPAVPLKGAGIYYKGNEGYGGFIAPRIKTYDYGPHISSRIPKMGDRLTDDKSVEVN